MTERRNLLLLCCSLVVGVSLFEVVVRASPFDYNLSPNWRYQPILGWSQVPSASYDFTLNGRAVHVSFNALGFRDREHQHRKPKGVKRVVVIGDSFCEAVQVNYEETFQQQLEKLLNQDGSEHWEVINLGVGDFGTAQEYIALREYGLAFDPDVVIQEVFPLNDICNNAIGMYDMCRSNNDLYRPYFVESHGQLQQTSSYPVAAYLRRHLVTYHVLEYWLLRLLSPNPQRPDDRGRAAYLRRNGFPTLDPLLFTYVADSSQQPRVVAEGWHITERLLEETVRMTRQRGIAYLAFVVPFEVQLGPKWEWFASQQPPPRMDRYYPERRLSLVFKRLGVPSVMLMDAFQPYSSEVLPYIDGHLSPAGHRRTAEALYGTLVASGIAGQQPRGTPVSHHS